MGTARPDEWAKDKRHAIERDTDPSVAAMIAHARDVLLPGAPVAALVGFAANGDPYNTTGWRRGDEEERAEAIRKGRFPFKSKDPRDTKVYGHIGSDDLHELERFGVEGGYCPTPCATDPKCSWVEGARSEGVRKILGRAGVEGAAWYGAIADAVAIGVWNIRRHMDAARKELDPRLSWERDDKPVSLWMFFCAISRWSAGGRGVRHINKFADRLAGLPENERVGEFMRAAAEVDDPGSRHKQDEYTALRSAQKLEAGRTACKITGEDVAWFFDGLDVDRDSVYDALVRAA